MKIVLVTSDITYVPKNYNDVFGYIVRNFTHSISGVVLIKINKFAVFVKFPYLYFAGCRNIANTLMHNIKDSLFKTKQKFLKKLGVPFVAVKSINDQKAILWLKAIKPDLIVNMRARCIYNNAVLKIPRLSCVNVHHGILPYQKGLFCDLYALAENRTAGFTIHQMTERIDQGKILYQEIVKGNKNYIDYLTEVASKEKTAIANFIRTTLRNKFLLEAATSHKSQKIITTTTPDFKKIKEFQRKGMIL